MSRTFTAAEVATHNKDNDCWIVIDGKVYDVTKFLADHPGGKKVVMALAGKDATVKFNALHKAEETLRKYGPQLLIGTLAGSSAAAPAASAPAPVPQPAAAAPAAAAPAKKAAKQSGGSAGTFGDMVPYGDPNWYQGWNSPYYNDSHRRFRAAVREFVAREISPNCGAWDDAKSIPKEVYLKAAQAGWLAGCIGHWPREYVGDHIAGGVKPEEWDPFHELILIDEVVRCGSGGVAWGMVGGLSIGLPPIHNFGSQFLKDKVSGPCLRGEKVICLAITEPYAGSDVANLQCTAVKTADGRHYIVNGEKKWITNGVFADFFTVAVRTGGPGSGMGGISLLLIERAMGGVTTKQMNCMGVLSSGTTYITFEDVKVPVENLIGQENQGFKYIMYNFNHERWQLCVQAARLARVLLEESMKYAMKRETFGKKLIEHPVIRLKLAHMARQVESTWAAIENVTYQVKTLGKEAQMKTLGGPIALLKAQSTQTFEYCAREACQIFGGLSYTKGGQGEKVERLYREVRAFSIPGGSEEIMLDLGIRQAVRSKL